MAIKLPEDVTHLREMVRRFVAEDVEPRAGEIEETNRVPDDVLDKARELGLFGLSIPEEYGGVGESELASSVALEAMSYGPGGVTFYIAPSAPAAAIRLVGTDEQKQRFLPDLATGKQFAAFCLSEAGAGSDAAGIKTRAIRKNGKWVINGTKLWVSRAATSSVFLVSAVTDPEKGGKGGTTVFLLDRRDGLTTGRADLQLGGRGSGSAEVNFSDVVAEDHEVLGDVGNGFGALKFILGRARLWAAARAVGIIGRAAELSIEHANSREQFGQKLAEFQLVKEKIANMAADLFAARLHVYQTANLYDEGYDPAQEAAYAKLFCSEAAFRAADHCVQLHGAMGVAQGFPVERLFRDVRAYRILDGTTDIQRLMIASRVVKHGLGINIAPGSMA